MTAAWIAAALATLVLGQLLVPAGMTVPIRRRRGR